MITFWEGRSRPFEVQVGDVLFIAGAMPFDLNKRPIFEHVVLSAENKIIKKPRDFKKLHVYGLPEAQWMRRRPQGIQYNTGEFWLEQHSDGVRAAFSSSNIGSQRYVWNLGGRQGHRGNYSPIELGLNLARIEGGWDCSYGCNFVVEPLLKLPVKTNCLGYVCSVFEYFGIKILGHVFPAYPEPYGETGKPDRTYPSPGHLAHVLNNDSFPLPWCPANRVEAETYSRADRTLHAVVSIAPKRGFIDLVKQRLAEFRKFFRR